MTDPVKKIAEFMADAERRARANIVGARKLKDEFDAVDGVPSLTRVMLFAQLDALVTAYSADLLALHREMVDHAQSWGVDVDPAEPNDGDGVVTPFSGGR